MASGYYEIVNFENILHLAETIMAYRNIRGWLSAADRAKPAYGAFMNIMAQWKEVIDGFSFQMDRFIEDSLNEIARLLIDRANELSADRRAKTALLFQRLARAFKLTIATLNYDDVVERSIDNWNDGFEAVDGMQVFSPLSLVEESNVPQLLHLHGSVRFYTKQDGAGLSIARGESTAEADAPQGRRVFFKDTQAGDPIVLGPMISGLRKSDKVSITPYGYYNWALRDALIRHPKLLVIGYGGFDSYISDMIQGVYDVHGDNTRAAFVGLRDKTKPITDFGLLLPIYLMGSRMALSDRRAELDGLVGLRSWSGNNTCKYFVDGFPLSETEIDEMLVFLQS
ncbi:MAG TPA: SIR2 family protein [Candidatus Binatia bacterium]|nr:SIR2 family protein [Candidatus Binatia bacterium]